MKQETEKEVRQEREIIVRVQDIMGLDMIGKETENKDLEIIITLSQKIDHGHEKEIVIKIEEEDPDLDPDHEINTIDEYTNYKIYKLYDF